MAKGRKITMQDNRCRLSATHHLLMGMMMATAMGLVMVRASPAAEKPAAPVVVASSGNVAFPGALGWAADTIGGRGGEIVRVTTLATEGPGSLLEALSRKGPRMIVFEVGGVIDLGNKTVKLTEPFVTIAGQTAPSPGITLIKGGLDIATHDVIIQHIRIRVGEAGQPKKSGNDHDGISTVAAYNVIVDHCSLTWATDENLSASGPRFKGNTPEEWRRNTSHRITFSNNIISQGLRYSTHAKIEHSKGSLIHDNVTDILIYGNLYAHNVERNPFFKGGVHGAIVNNLIYNSGQRAIHYNLMAEEWGNMPYQVGKMSAVGNVFRAGPDTPEHMSFLMIGGYGDLEYYAKDNIAVDQAGEPIRQIGRYTTAPAKVIELKKPDIWPQGLTALPATDVQRYVLSQAGARPWDRDKDDVQLISDVAEGRGNIIDSENDLHGYPTPTPTSKPFNPDDWNLENMTPKRSEILDSATKAKGT
jgi:hypothetical protein